MSTFCKDVPDANPDRWEGQSCFSFALEGNPGGSFSLCEVGFQNKPQKGSCGFTHPQPGHCLAETSGM